MLNKEKVIKLMLTAKNLDELQEYHAKGSIQAIKSIAVQELYRKLTKKFKK